MTIGAIDPKLKEQIDHKQNWIQFFVAMEQWDRALFCIKHNAELVEKI